MGVTENFDPDGVDEGEVVNVPLCLECLQPVDPGKYYCENCGGASNGLTQYLPFVNIQWYVRFYVKMCRQVRSPEVSVLGKTIRVFVIVFTWPLLLVLLPFVEGDVDHQEREEDEGD